MKLKSLKEANLKEKTVIYRSPYDIGVEKSEDGSYRVTDDSRIKVTIPTIQYLLQQECKVVVMTYVKRPGGKYDGSLTTKPHAEALSKLLGKPVDKLNDCVGDKVREHISQMQSGQLVMLENTRFHPEENQDNDDFAKELAKNGEVAVFDCFPQAHREHASTTGLLRHMESYAGFYFEKEVNELSKLLENIERPYTVVIGGAKVSDKIDAIRNLYNLADIILVGGGVANAFLTAEGKNLGNSYLESIEVNQKFEDESSVDLALELLQMETTSKSDTYRNFNVHENIEMHKIMLPYDLVISDDGSINIAVAHKTIDVVPGGWSALDIGPKAQMIFSEIIDQSKTVFWSGPLGKFEDERFAQGSRAIADTMSKVEGTSIVAGGDTIEVINKYGNTKDYTHVSLAGGATLAFLAGEKLPVLEALKA